MNNDLVLHQDDDLSERPREEVEAAARKWFDIANDMKTIQEQLVDDLETALNACKQYQRAAAIHEDPDPNFVTVRNLLTKYKMDYVPAAKTARVFVDGVDITEHPDSIEGDADVMELTSEEYNGIETVELVQLEDGSMHFVPGTIEHAPEVDTFAEVADPEEPVDPGSREWLQEEQYTIERTIAPLIMALKGMDPHDPRYKEIALIPTPEELESTQGDMDITASREWHVEGDDDDGEIDSPHLPSRDEVESFFTQGITLNDEDIAAIHDALERE